MAATNYLAPVSTEDLIERLAKLKEMGLKTRAKLDAGDRGEVYTYIVEGGRQRPVRRTEYFLTTQRAAWQETRNELRRRGL